MKRLFNAAAIYTLLGLLSGVFYREFTKANEFPEGAFSQLGLVHTHLLTLGTVVLLIALVIEKTFVVSRSTKLFGAFFWLYNVGLMVTSGLMVWHGTLTVLGKESSAMISGIAGLGHILLTAGLVCFFIALGRAVKSADTTRAQVHAA